MSRTPRRRTARPRRLPAALAALAGVLALTAAAPAAAPAVAPGPGPGPAAAMPPAARDTEPVCTGAAGPALPVAGGGTVTWCETAAGGRLTYTNTGRADADLSLVVYDCDGGKAPSTDSAKCAATLRSTSDVIWRRIAPQQSEHADFAIKRGSNAQVWYTTDGTDRASALRLLGTPWNS